MSAFSRILFPVDLSPSSPKLAGYVKSMVEKPEAVLHLLFVARDLSHFGGINVPFAAINNLNEALSKGAEVNLEKFRDRHFPGMNVTIAVRSGDIADQILDYARENGVDLIVMGTHGRKGMEKVLLGSVAERVIKGAAVPVMVVNPHRIPKQSPVAS